MSSQTFEALFENATGKKTPNPYQTSLATRPIESRLINVPTGCGKTAAVILGWVWRRQNNPMQTPRRLIYCLSMRLLVEQTRDRALISTQVVEAGADVSARMLLAELQIV